MVHSDSEETRKEGLIRFGVFDVEPAAGELRRQGVRVRLQEQPFRLLLMMLGRGNAILTREEIQSDLWPADTFVDFDRGLNRAINKLRKALGDDAGNARFIETLPRRGYRFLVPVSRVEAQVTHSSRQDEARRDGNIAFLRRRLPLVLGLTALLLGFGAWSLRLAFQLLRPERPIQSIAVLPLHNLSGSPSQDLFADGLTDELITDLARISSLRVISRNSVMRFRSSRLRLQEIAKDLNVDAVVQGTVEYSAARVRVTAQLIDVRQDRHVWSEKYERDAGEAVKLQGEVAQAIARQIKIKLTSAEQARITSVRPVSQQAYEAYLQGRYFGAKVGEEDLNRSITLLKRAVELEPGYAEAYAGLSHSYYVIGLLGIEPAARAYMMAKASALKTLEIDETVPEAHNTLAEIKKGYEWDWPGAEAEYKKIIELNPNDALAHIGYADLLTKIGRYNEAIVHSNYARELDPTSAGTYTALGRVLYRARKYDDCIAACQRAHELDPNYVNALWWMALSYEQKHDLPQSLATLRKAVSLSDSPIYVALLGRAYALGGDQNKAREILAKLTRLSGQRYVSPVDIATVHVGLGDRDAAFRWFETAYQERATRIQELPDPTFDSVRSDHRFQTLMQLVGLPVN